eukprot:4851877-Prymnesium_polylepis.1
MDQRKSASEKARALSRMGIWHLNATVAPEQPCNNCKDAPPCQLPPQAAPKLSIPALECRNYCCTRARSINHSLPARNKDRLIGIGICQGPYQEECWAALNNGSVSQVMKKVRLFQGFFKAAPSDHRHMASDKFWFPPEKKPVVTRVHFSKAGFLKRDQIHMQVIGSCDLNRQHLLSAASRSWCNPNADGLNCSFYLDGECAEGIRNILAPGSGEKVITPREYLGHVQWPQQAACCNRSVAFSFRFISEPGFHSWNGFGPSSFYCSASRMKTRLHQVHCLRPSLFCVSA